MLTAGKDYFINFTEQQKKFYLSLYCYEESLNNC